MKNLYFLAAVFCFLQSVAQQKLADSLFFEKKYEKAKQLYLKEPDLETNALTLNRLGFCFHKTKKLDEAIVYYIKSEKLAKNQALAVTVQARLAKVYSMQRQDQKSLEYLRKAVSNGYANVSELNSDPDFSNLRKAKSFEHIYDSLYNITYPCKKDPKRREFDFWLGTWNVFTTQGDHPAGESNIDYASEGCMILENYKSFGGYTGKSMNYVNEKNEWEQTWMGSDGAVAKFDHGKYDGKEMLFTFEKTDRNGNKKTGKFHFYKIGNNVVRQMQESSADNGITYSVDYDLTYKRKK